MNGSAVTGNEESAGRHGWARWLTRCVCLAAATTLLLPLPFWPASSVFVPAASSFVAVVSVVASHAWQATFLVGLFVGIIALVRRRWFCRWVCPTGFCTDGASRVGLVCRRRCPRVPSVGPWIVWITIAGALFGYPLLAWLDPLAIFAAAFTALHSNSLQAAGWASIGMPALLVLSVLFPTLWCVRICPLGAMQDILWAVSPFLRPRGTAARNRAMGGGPFRFGRRAVLSGAVGAAWAAATNTLRASAKRPLRPPGALHETVFTGVCIRCGNCVRVCPTRIIEPDVGQYGPAGLLAPIVHFRRNYCLEDCTRCTDVCPSGALAPLAVQDKLRAPLGFPRVDMNVCLLAEERECSACRSHCPYDAVRYVFSEATYMVEPRIDPSKCPGCGACEVACPTSPVKAIVVFPLAPNP